jgi:GNAT superfamily N-acetyltransferase
MPVPNSVRLARATDVDAIATVQRRAWRQSYAAILPAEALTELDDADLAWEWGRAILAAGDHRVFVALNEGEGDVVGVASVGPTADPDISPETSGEIGVLLVDPDYQRAGHGSRLMAACIDMMRAADKSDCATWIPLDDQARRVFFTSAGWGPDSAYRDLEFTPGVTVREVRLVTSWVPEEPGAE